ncbi:MAG: hypothetical protein ACR2H2_07735 [Solirubrobacteraceae bacterium]
MAHAIEQHAVANAAGDPMQVGSRFDMWARVTFLQQGAALGSSVLAERIDARATIDVLTRIDRIFDVLVEVWHPAAQAWRPLTVGEQRTPSDLRGR